MSNLTSGALNFDDRFFDNFSLLLTGEGSSPNSSMLISSSMLNVGLGVVLLSDE